MQKRRNYLFGQQRRREEYDALPVLDDKKGIYR